MSWTRSRRKLRSGWRYSARIRSGRASSLSRNFSSLYASGRCITSRGFMMKRPGEIDKATLDVGVDELDANAIADVKALVAAHDFTLRGGLN